MTVWIAKWHRKGGVVGLLARLTPCLDLGSGPCGGLAFAALCSEGRDGRLWLMLGRPAFDDVHCLVAFHISCTLAHRLRCFWRSIVKDDRELHHRAGHTQSISAVLQKPA